jgi:hypothetical protein
MGWWADGRCDVFFTTFGMKNKMKSSWISGWNAHYSWVNRSFERANCNALPSAPIFVGKIITLGG